MVSLVHTSSLRVVVLNLVLHAHVSQPDWLILPLFFLCADIEGWGISPRGAGYLFGSDVVQQVGVHICDTLFSLLM